MERKRNGIEIEDNLENEGEEVIPFKYSITSYGADYPVDGLVKRIEGDDIHIPPFQRGFVWSVNMASRFIESLLLGLPVPGIFLAKEHKTQRLLVIDGQQRLRTLQLFYNGIWIDNKKAFALKEVQTNFEGLTYKNLKDEDRRRLNDSILHATIVKQDEPSDDDSSIYHIFERLNTGGLQLTPQEIRACIYHGELNKLLGELNENKSWRSLYGAVSSRMRDQELILRFLALYFDSPSYKKPMKEFLNTYMGKNRYLTQQDSDMIKEIFVPTIQLVHQHIGKEAFKPRKALVAAIFDSVMVGVARRRKIGILTKPGMLLKHYQTLLSKNDFILATESHTSDEENVSRRISIAVDTFESVE